MHGDRASERRGLQNHRSRERYPDRAPILSECSSVGRASPCQGDCHEFESHRPLQFYKRNDNVRAD